MVKKPQTRTELKNDCDFREMYPVATYSMNIQSLLLNVEKFFKELQFRETATYLKRRPFGCFNWVWGIYCTICNFLPLGDRAMQSLQSASPG